MGLHFVFKNVSFSSNSSVLYFINILVQDGLGVLVQITGSSPQRVCEALAGRVRPRYRVRAERDHEFENQRETVLKASQAALTSPCLLQ